MSRKKKALGKTKKTKKTKQSLQGAVKDFVIHSSIQLSQQTLKVFDKKSFTKLRRWAKLPTAAERIRMTNERLLASLMKVGVAPQSELDELRNKIERLETTRKNRSGNTRV
jgi:hypothetical protein